MGTERHQISLGWFVILALLLHAVVLNNHFPSPEAIEKYLAEKTKKKPSEIELIDPKTLEDKEVVASSKLKEQDPELLKNKGRYYSDETNRVKEETRSPLHGRFQEGHIFAQKQKEKEGSELPLGEDGEVAAGKSQGSDGPQLKDLMAFSRTPNELSKDIKEGAETILNTDKVLYASFINRVADEVYGPWYSNLQTALQERQVQQKKLETNVYTTRLLLTLDKEGEIQSIQITKSCGIHEIDDAPKKAFWSLEGFRNPPSQLVSTDGFIRITYEFHLEYNNSIFRVSPTQL